MFSAEFQYALLLLTEVKAKQNLEPVTVDDVADKYGIKREFLFKVARKLRMAGYVRSVRGPGGGYVAGMDLSTLEFWKLYQDVHLQNSLLKPATTNKKALELLEREYELFINSLQCFGVRL